MPIWWRPAGAFALGVALPGERRLERGAARRRAPTPGSDTLEWSEPSPAPQAQFATLPVVTSRHPLWQQTTFEPPTPRRPAVDQLDEAPTRWRGGLVVSRGTRPLAVAHLPSSTIFPFVMSVGFAILFVAALLDGIVLAGLGIAVSAVGLTVGPGDRRPSVSPSPRWTKVVTARCRSPWSDRCRMAGGGRSCCSRYWAPPSRLPTASLREPGRRRFLAFHPAGWRGGNRPWLRGAGPRPARSSTAPAAASARTARGDAERRLSSGISLDVAFVGLAVAAFRATGVTPESSAYGSIVLALFLFQWLAGGLTLVMLGTAVSWAILAPADIRGHATLVNAALVSHFALGAALIVFATIHLGPRLS